MTRTKSTFLGILFTLLVALFLCPTLAGAALAEQSSGWQIVPSPNPPHSANGFNGVAAIAANDVWASGSYNPVNANVPTLTIVVHWNGKAWSIVPSPNATPYLNYLEGMSAASANDIWVVGGYLDRTHPEKTLIEHWNGMAWAIIPSPNVGVYSDELEAVKALSATNVWAVGHDYVNNASQTLVEHWNGTTWSVVSSLNSGSGNNGLSGIAAISATNIWAVGVYGNIFQEYKSLTLLYR